ncbi:RNA-binding protein [Candidatus Sumerlaeota bacterium]|nr:RNA-binding protein [Candidatus Sumerlaeota bacterium]
MQGSKLYVGNLNYSVTTDQMEALFAQFGQVKDVRIIEGKGFGFVELSSAEEAAKAMETLNGSEFEGRKLRIDEARPPKKRERRDF